MPRPVDPHAKIDLLRAAEAVFVEHGLEKARVEEITARAGKSKGSFYLHFASKEEAFRQIVETTLARLAGYLEQMEPSAGAPHGLDQMVESWFELEVELFEFLWQNRGVMRLLLQGGGSASFGYLADAFAERARERTKEWLRLSVERGHYRKDLDIEVASLVISGAYDRLARALVRLDKKPDIRAWVRGAQRVLLIGCCAPDARDVVDQSVSEFVEPIPASTASVKRIDVSGGARAVVRRPA
jgi:AcrR family transcriptional regulator